MKIASIVLIWVGIIYLLKSIGIIQVINWSIIWPVLIIILGFSIKHYKHSMMCAVGGKCGACETGKSL
ncbi:hypothetical protein AUJ77_00880 [Candidatus Nomurabacteria bacterium CG1_02_43_90]|uniref:LiaF transmembrane domain-containing protein n=1 Tax=Candidatus Nomurabacteria bacterium CG1_02_43_90 TaxID=1805281 RepID=A0A1J4V4W6_9BACT|nr:MAG: hypothetical protein AUJ77_00880 [Candidatus Nomurabacteria bacterium CG1_02_43_90]